ncbi:MAG: hypothetical protein HRU15_13435, partial [Planctomycetes bacterium]|nr:hypothetical protein [Planctomycetota bacterium]
MAEHGHSDKVVVSCSFCQKKYTVREALIGRQARCSSCTLQFILCTEDNDASAITLHMQAGGETVVAAGGTAGTAESEQDNSDVTLHSMSPAMQDPNEASTMVVGSNENDAQTVAGDMPAISAMSEDQASVTLPMQNKARDNRCAESVGIKTGESNNRYVIGREMARGGMGAILETRDVNLRRD